MIKENVSQLLNDQINAEYFSAYLYFSMSIYCDQQGYKGFANWFRVQTKEEMAHGTHIFDHLLDRGVAPTLTAISAPPSNFAGIKDLYAKSLKHEQAVTERINKIASAALQENDHATYQFISWYISEQTEEESTASELLQKVTLIGDNQAMLFALDTELAARVYTDPFANA